MGQVLLQKKASDDRLKVIELREVKKKTFKEIGNLFMVSSNRAMQIYNKAKIIQEYGYDNPDNPFYGLTTHARRVCKERGLMNRDQIIAAVKEGRLHPKNNSICDRCLKQYHDEMCLKHPEYEQGVIAGHIVIKRVNLSRNYGIKTYIEICEWAGQPEISERTPCPLCGCKGLDHKLLCPRCGVEINKKLSCQEN